MTQGELVSVVAQLMVYWSVYLFGVAFFGYLAGQVAEALGVATWRFLARGRKLPPFAERVRTVEHLMQLRINALSRIRARMYREAQRRGETIEGL